MASNIVTPAHLAQLNNALDMLQRLQAEIDLAKRAKIDVSQYEQQAQALQDQIRQFKNVYFPNG